MDDYSLLYNHFKKLYQKILVNRGNLYYPEYWVDITTLRQFVKYILSYSTTDVREHIESIQQDIDIIHYILNVIIKKTSKVWPESNENIQKIIHQYQYMSICDWLHLVYEFIDEIYVSIDKQTTCGYELDYSRIIDVLINTVNCRWTLEKTHPYIKFPRERVLSFR